MCVGDGPGIAGLQAFVQQGVWIALSAVAIFYYVGLVVSVAEAQYAISMESSMGYTRALEQALGMTIMLGLAAAANSLSGVIQGLVCTAMGGAVMGGDGAGIITLWNTIAHLVVTLVVSGSVIFVTVRAAFSGLGMQLAHLQGSPHSVSESTVKLITIIIGGILTILASWAANLILNVVLTQAGSG